MCRIGSKNSTLPCTQIFSRLESSSKHLWIKKVVKDVLHFFLGLPQLLIDDLFLPTCKPLINVEAKLVKKTWTFAKVKIWPKTCFVFNIPLNRKCKTKKAHLFQSARVFSFCKTCLLFLKEYLFFFNVREGNADLLVSWSCE